MHLTANVYDSKTICAYKWKCTLHLVTGEYVYCTKIWETQWSTLSPNLWKSFRVTLLLVNLEKFLVSVNSRRYAQKPVYTDNRLFFFLKLELTTLLSKYYLSSRWLKPEHITAYWCPSSDTSSTIKKWYNSTMKTLKCQSTTSVHTEYITCIYLLCRCHTWECLSYEYHGKCMYINY